jgi:hypothetical protein
VSERVWFRRFGEKRASGNCAAKGYRPEYPLRFHVSPLLGLNRRAWYASKALAWRALAALQLEIEAAEAADPS